MHCNINDLQNCEKTPICLGNWCFTCRSVGLFFSFNNFFRILVSQFTIDDSLTTGLCKRHLKIKEKITLRWKDQTIQENIYPEHIVIGL